MKYTVNQGKSDERDVLVIERVRRTALGKAVETFLNCKKTNSTYRVTTDYEKYQGKEVIVNLRVDVLTKNNDIVAIDVIKDACLYIVDLLKVSSDVLLYVVTIFAENYPYCKVLLYRELETDYLDYLHIQGNISLEEDIKTLYEIEQFLCKTACDNCDYRVNEFLDERADNLKSYAELINPIKPRWSLLNGSVK